MINVLPSCNIIQKYNIHLIYIILKDTIKPHIDKHARYILGDLGFDVELLSFDYRRSFHAQNTCFLFAHEKHENKRRLYNGSPLLHVTLKSFQIIGENLRR